MKLLILALYIGLLAAMAQTAQLEHDQGQQAVTLRAWVRATTEAHARICKIDPKVCKEE
jgi:hypothetical protein